MAKTGRNDPCPCGSGAKYKRCCLPRDEAAAAEAGATRAAEHPAPLDRRARAADLVERLASHFGAAQEDDDGLVDASNLPVDLIHEGKLDEAEKAARDLLARYPEVHDGLERLAAVYEARGDRGQAAIYYRKAHIFMTEHADYYDQEAIDWMRDKAEELERDA